MVSIYVERDSQKPIIIGRHAEHLLRIKKQMRTPVNRIVGARRILTSMSRWRRTGSPTQETRQMGF